jgi:Protein of unknown function (DUF2380)
MPAAHKPNTSSPAPRRRSVASFGVVALAIVVCAALGGESAAQQGAAPIKIAVFNFELEDFSAAHAAGASPVETKYLAQATEEAKRALTQSGRYAVVDTAGADLSAAQGHGLSNCDGCDAAIAGKLGADQDLIGVVTKISMTEYTVTLRIRDVHNGADVKTYSTGLRMGADYSWVRGVTWLMKNRVLASKP